MHKLENVVKDNFEATSKTKEVAGDLEGLSNKIINEVEKNRFNAK